MIEELRLKEEGFQTLQGVTAPSGVYALVKGMEVVYIGRSTNLYARVAQHHARRNKPKVQVYEIISGGVNFHIAFDRVLVKFCTSHEARILESELINRVRPKYNKDIPEPIRDHGIDLEALAKSAGVELTEEPMLSAAGRRSLR